MRGVLLCLLIATACSHRPKNGIVEGKSAASCPAGGGCRDGELCEYPGGSCYCGRPQYCGGIPPSREYEEQPTTWQCSPNPPEVRDDGCPGSPPTGACSDDGQTCEYEVSCCQQTSVCRDGAWASTTHDCPL